MDQASLDRIRIINKRFTNKILIHLCGRRSGHFAILSHTGRKSGRQYRIPVIAEPVDEGFMVALTYGKKVDWFKNVMTLGGCELYWKNKEYKLVHPELVDSKIGLPAFPALFRSGLRKMGIKYYLKLEVQK
jgi:deazaflavin-dependent oxidoreductase (nitroreductase family)